MNGETKPYVSPTYLNSGNGQ